MVTTDRETGAPAPHWTPKTGRRTVGISLMGSAEADAAVELVREEYPDAHISYRDCFYKIERDDLLEFDMDRLSDRLGHELSTEMFLVTMSTYYGRLVRSNDKIQIFADILPDRFKG
jgi:MmoB/DmpM family